MPVAGEKFARDSIAAVYIHATAVNNLLRNDGLLEFGRIGAALASFALAILAAIAAFACGSAPAWRWSAISARGDASTIP